VARAVTALVPPAEDHDRFLSSSTSGPVDCIPPSPVDHRTMEQEVDGWIAQLGQCKQLSEADVKRLCDKVRSRRRPRVRAR
jgi:hypothetical protein